MRGLTEARCPECGAKSEWLELREARDKAPIFEYRGTTGSLIGGLLSMFAVYINEGDSYFPWYWLLLDKMPPSLNPILALPILLVGVFVSTLALGIACRRYLQVRHAWGVACMTGLVLSLWLFVLVIGLRQRLSERPLVATMPAWTPPSRARATSSTTASPIDFIWGRRSTSVATGRQSPTSQSVRSAPASRCPPTTSPSG
jgi:hypothetical protein